MSDWEDFEKQLLKKYTKEYREAFGWEAAQAPLTITESSAYTPQELAKVKALQQQWTALSERGQKEGWLAWSGGYADGEWELEHESKLKHPNRTGTRPESKAERNSRLSTLEYRIKQAAKERVRKEMQPKKGLFG